MMLGGTMARTETIRKGEFLCPHCNHPEDYCHVRVATYYHVLRFPLVENGVIADYIECQRCTRQFAPSGVQVDNLILSSLVVPPKEKSAVKVTLSASRRKRVKKDSRSRRKRKNDKLTSTAHS